MLIQTQSYLEFAIRAARQRCNHSMSSDVSIAANEFEDSFEAGKSLSDWLSILKRRRWAMLITMGILSIITLLVAFLFPATYRSTATILIEQQEIPQDFVRSTITTFADQRLQVIQQRVMTYANLFQIIDQFDLYPVMLEKEPREVVLEEIREAISLDIISADVIDPRSGRPTQATIAFNVSFDHKSPGLSHKVAQKIMDLFLEENIKQRTKKAKEATSFLDDEANKLEDQIAELEEELAEFKKGNVEKLPELVSMNITLMDRTDQEIKQVDQQLRALKERKIYLESELAQMDPTAALYSEQGDRLLGSGDRLKVLRIQLAQISGVYSDDHPDILRLKREIKALEADEGNSSTSSKDIRTELQLLRQQLQEAKLKYSSDHPDVKSLQRSIRSMEQSLANSSYDSVYPQRSEISNPAYSQLLAQLEAANAEIGSLKISRSSLQAKIGTLERRLLESPEVERKYRALAREYDTARAKYVDVKAKLSEAKIGESLEMGKQSEKFTVIEPPLFPQQPISPNRPAILLLGILFSAAIAFGIALIREMLDDAVHDRATVLALTGLMPIAVLPTIYTADEVSSGRNKKILLVLLGMAAVSAGLLLVHLYYLPLDVLFYKVLRKI